MIFLIVVLKLLLSQVVILEIYRFRGSPFPYTNAPFCGERREISKTKVLKTTLLVGGGTIVVDF